MSGPVSFATDRRTILMPVDGLRELRTRMGALESAESALAKTDRAIETGETLKLDIHEKAVTLLAVTHWLNHPSSGGGDPWAVLRDLRDELAHDLA
jgi:hypothetical protein